MANHNPITRIGDLADSVSETHKFGKEKLIFLNTSDILHGKILHRTYSAVKDWPGQAKKSICKDDILFSEIRPANGRWAYVEEDADDFVVSTKLMVIRTRKDKLFPKFFYQFLTSSEITRWLQHLAESRSGTFPQITFDEVASLELPLPSLATQHAIAAVLGSLDDKIELNRRMNETLEALAQSLFKSWIVDATQSALPKGWRKATIRELCEFAYGKALKAETRRAGSVPVYGSNGQVGWHDEALVKGPGIVVGRKGNPGIVIWSPTDFFPIDTTFYVVPKGECRSLYFLFHALRAHDLASLGADSAVPGLNRNMAYMSKQVLPPSDVQEAFDKQVRPLFELVHHNNEESRTLAGLRDALLPKLLSGELRVPVKGN